jgi:hypothetical protein
VKTGQRQDGRICGAVKVVEIGGAEPEPTVTRNLSPGGMFLITKSQWPLGTVVPFHVAHRYWEADVKARVVHTQATGVGLEFVDLDDNAKAMINRIIEGLLADGAWYDERRRTLRAQIRGTVVWRHGTVEVESNLRDLTTQGAFIETSQAPETGTEIYVYLPLQGIGTDRPSQPSVCGSQATVVRREPGGFAAEFVSPCEEFQSVVKNLVALADVSGQPASSS